EVDAQDIGELLDQPDEPIAQRGVLARLRALPGVLEEPVRQIRIAAHDGAVDGDRRARAPRGVGERRVAPGQEALHRVGPEFAERALGAMLDEDADLVLDAEYLAARAVAVAA